VKANDLISVVSALQPSQARLAITMSRKNRFVYLFVVLGLLSTTAQLSFAQSNPLGFSRNYFVTGDYIVGGVGLQGLGDGSGFATGIINIPDKNSVPATGVPNGAEIVAAFLYWQTVEKSATSFTGQNGFFGPIVDNSDGSTTAFRYAISGITLSASSPIGWGSGGCAGASNGTKVLRTYRADVRPFLKLDADGNAVGNGSYQVSLADSGSNGGGVPLTLGASLVLIYRLLPATTLNAIVIYDGAFAPTSSSPQVSQQIQGFYEASSPAAPIAKLTHIVGSGQAKKGQQIFLNNVALPSLYPGLPPFPGFYNGSWDNPTWDNVNQLTGKMVVNSGDSAATTTVVPSSSNSGCVSWGAMIFSTTVQDSDNDGLLDVWKSLQGYTDVGTGQWVALPGARGGEKDIFVEVDYLVNYASGGTTVLHSHLPKQAALDEVGAAFEKQNIKVHFDLGPGIYNNPPDPYVIQYPVQVPPGATVPPSTGGNAISEAALLCSDGATLCAFPGQPAIGWKGGFLFVRNNATTTLANGTTYHLGNFEPGRANSYHYMLFAHSLGMARSFWSAFGILTPTSLQGKLVSIVNSGTTATVTIQSPPGLIKPGDCPNAAIPACSDANANRVSVVGALGQLNLNASYEPFTITSQTTANNITTTVFTITTTGVADGPYSFSNEPQLGLAYLGPTSSSGHSDFRGGGDSTVTFGLWNYDDPPFCQPDPSQPPGAQGYCNDQVGSVIVQAGTLMH
jgi:hypothetical protein